MLECVQVPFEFFCCIEQRQILGLKAETDLTMSNKEQPIRIRRMREVLRDRDVCRWAADLFTDLVQVRIETSVASEV